MIKFETVAKIGSIVKRSLIISYIILELHIAFHMKEFSFFVELWHKIG